MNLTDVSRFFDRTPILDASTLAQVGLGQILAFDDSHRDNATSYRRTLSTTPGVELPPVIQAMGQTWMVGGGQVDGWSQAHRVKYAIQLVAPVQAIQTPSDYLLGVDAGSTWGALNWSADGKELAHSSDVLGEVNATLPCGTAVPPHAFITENGTCHLALRSAKSALGFTEVRCRLLNSPLPSPVTITSRQYNPATGSTSGAAVATVQGKLLLWQDFYTYFSQADERRQEGDSTLLVPATTTVTTASEVSTLGLTYTVLAITPVDGVLALHVRPRK